MDSDGLATLLELSGEGPGYREITIFRWALFVYAGPIVEGSSGRGRRSQVELLQRGLRLLLLSCLKPFGNRVKLLQGQIAWSGAAAPTRGPVKAVLSCLKWLAWALGYFLGAVGVGSVLRVP